MENAENKPLFVIDEDPTVVWPVNVKLPQAGGEFAEYQFDVTMRVLSPDQYEALMKDLPDFKPKESDSEIPKLPALSEVVQANVPAFQKIITGWSKVKDRDGKDVPFTPERLAAQITGPRGPAISTGIWRAVNEVRYGSHLPGGALKESARAGN